MNCHLIFLREQLVKLVKIQNISQSYTNTKNDDLNTYIMMTFINVLSHT